MQPDDVRHQPAESWASAAAAVVERVDGNALVAADCVTATGDGDSASERDAWARHAFGWRKHIVEERRGDGGFLLLRDADAAAGIAISSDCAAGDVAA